MPRFPAHEPLYQSFSAFMRNCWLADGSLLWPDRAVWTIATLEAMRRRFVELFLEGRLSFREKFEAQLEGAPAELWAMAADCFYVYGLGSHTIRFATKLNLLTWCAQQAGLTLPPPESPLWAALKTGAAATGQKYNLKHAQVRLLTLAALEIKALPDRSAALASPAALQRVLDGILESIPLKIDRANDMRNVILYLAFPEQYEPIVSNRDKDAVLFYYQGRVKKKLAADRDEALRQVRAALSPRFRDRPHPFDFFTDLRSEWRQGLELEQALVRAGTRQRRGAGPTTQPAQSSAGLAAPSKVRELRASYQAVEPVSDPDLRRILAAFRQTPNVILTGPPGVGKTHLAGLAAAHLTQAETEQTVRWVTFHPSYAYEDFVEGVRPVLGAQGQLAYQVRPGIFREICELALRSPDRPYVLVIDEINRGNLARILGELITLLEPDKRGRLSVLLPYSGQPFSVPPNLMILGTMNTADRSIALMDAALRRRFAFVEIEPRPDLLVGAVVETEEASVALDALLRGLNAAITHSLDSSHRIGHSYFLPVAQAAPPERLERLAFAWNQQVLPLLEEYFYARPDRLREILAPFVDESEEWGEIERLSGEDLVVALHRISLYPDRPR